jgi:hypothetical protein
MTRLLALTAAVTVKELPGGRFIGDWIAKRK